MKYFWAALSAIDLVVALADFTHGLFVEGVFLLCLSFFFGLKSYILARCE